MLKFCRSLTILLLLTLFIVGCSRGNDNKTNSVDTTPMSTPIPTSTPTSTPIPTPTPIVLPPPAINAPATSAPKFTPSCILWFIACSTPPTSTPCQSHYVFDDLINGGQSWKVVDTQQDQNNSTSPAQVTFTSKTSTTVTVTDKLDVITTVGGSLSASDDGITATITASVKTEIDTEVSKAVTTSINNSYAFTIPPGKTAYANYGVKVQITIGRLYDSAGCEGQNSYRGIDTTYVPIATGWCAWTSGGTPCPSV